MPLDGRQNEFWEAATVNGSVLLLSLETRDRSHGQLSTSFQ